jgi:hypothetical protein
MILKNAVFLGCDAVHFGVRLLIFLRNVVSVSSEQNRQHCSLRPRYLFIRLWHNIPEDSSISTHQTHPILLQQDFNKFAQK